MAEVLNGRSRRGRKPETVMLVPRPRAARLRRNAPAASEPLLADE